MFREGTSCKWRFSLIIVLILSSRTVSAIELGYENCQEVPLFVLYNKNRERLIFLFQFVFSVY